MSEYDPSTPPEPQAWLDLDELERIRLVEVFHRRQRMHPLRLKAHAVFHAIIENQLAEGVGSVARAMGRLQEQGLSRHDALHAIASVLAEHTHALLAGGIADSPEAAQSRYDAALDRLTAAGWRGLHGPKQ